MKLDLFDPYNIRVRLSSSIILFAPIMITLFLCFNDIYTIASSSIIVFILLSFTNYIPILQRRINKAKIFPEDRAAKLLHLEDATFDLLTKKRYYDRLSRMDVSLALFEQPDNSEEFRKCCKSAIVCLRARTRDNHLVQEENINYGFCKNLYANKKVGIILCVALNTFIFIYTKHLFITQAIKPINNYVAFVLNLSILIFWFFGINKKVLEETADKYAKTLVEAIDAVSLTV